MATISPLDMETIIESVQKTGRCVIVHEAARMCGVERWHCIHDVPQGLRVYAAESEQNNGPELRVATHAELYAGCVAGASLEGDYLRFVREAGFEDVRVVERTGYEVGAEAYADGSPEREAFASVVSIKVHATRGAAKR